MKQALVIHPRLDPYAGGEILSMYVIKVLKDSGYHVTLASNVFEPDKVQQIYRMGDVLEGVDHYPTPNFHPFAPRFMAAQRTHFSMRIIRETRLLQIAKEADIVLSTQSSLYSLPQNNLYHFIYNTHDLYAYPYGRLTLPSLSYETPLWKLHYYFGLNLSHRYVYGKFLKQYPPKVKMFFALSHFCQQALERMELDSQFIAPPVQMSFTPRPKKKQVIQVTRIVRQKRLEWFLEVARRLPEYRFIIVGKHVPITQLGTDTDYPERLLARKPGNVELVWDTIRNCPEILEESKVYLYTGIEQGIGIAMCEGIGAGCYPVSPRLGGGGEVVQLSGVGSMFDTIDDAVAATRKALEMDTDPYSIREHAKIFSTEVFEDKMRSILP